MVKVTRWHCELIYILIVPCLPSSSRPRFSTKSGFTGFWIIFFNNVTLCAATYIFSKWLLGDLECKRHRVFKRVGACVCGCTWYSDSVSYFQIFLFIAHSNLHSWVTDLQEVFIFFNKGLFILPLCFSRTDWEENRIRGETFRDSLIHCWFCAHLVNWLMFQMISDGLWLRLTGFSTIQSNKLEVCYGQQAQSPASSCDGLFVADLWARVFPYFLCEYWIWLAGHNNQSICLPPLQTYRGANH